MIWSTELPEILIRRQFIHSDLKIVSHVDLQNYTLDTHIDRVLSKINLSIINWNIGFFSLD
jgi:hypothetical protein